MSNIISIIFIIASLLLTFMYVNPTYNAITGNSENAKKSIKELKVEKQRYLEALEKVREIERVRDGLLAKYNAIQGSDREKLSKMVPEHIDSIRLIIDINNIAAVYNFFLKDISIGESPANPVRKEGSDSGVTVGQKNYPYVTLSFSITGTYNNLIAFISDLEKSLRLIDVENIKINIANTETQTKGKVLEPTYNMSMTIRTYFMASK